MSVSALLHDQDERIVVTSSRKLPNGETSWFDQFANSPEEADQFAHKQSNINRNVYIRHGLQDGTTTTKARPQCAAENFTGSRTFFIDIDVGDDPNDQYSTFDQAVTAFRVAVTELRRINFPAPNIVQLTGGGLQAAWVSDIIFASDEWDNLSRILYLLLSRFKLEVDRATRSIIRGIRYCGPKYVNVNHGKLRPTKLVHFNPVRCSGETIRTVLKQHGTLRAVNTSKKSEYDIAGQEFEFDIEVVASRCKVIEQALSTGGAEHSYEHWVNLLMLAASNIDENTGRAYAHGMSEDHPDYDRERTDAKFDEILAKGYGRLVKCGTLGAFDNGATCAGCQYRDRVNSPGGIQKFAWQENNARTKVNGHSHELSYNALLYGDIYYNADDGVRRRKQGKETVDPLVWHGISLSGFELRRLDQDFSELSVHFEAQSIGGEPNPRAVVMPVKSLGSTQTLTRELATQNCPPEHKRYSEVHSLMTRIYEWLQRSHTAEKIRFTRLGWSNGHQGFLLGNNYYRADGEVVKIHDAPVELADFNMEGDYDKYGELVNTIFSHEDRPEAHALIAAAFAAPLLELVGASPIALNFFSEKTAYGKTTLSTLAGSCWGRPSTTLFTLNDTENSVIKRVSQLNNLPGRYDEIRITSDVGDRLMELIFRLNAKIEKSRLSASSTVQERGHWNAPILFTTNYSFTDLMRHDRSGRGGDAGIARVMDFSLPPLLHDAHTRMPIIMNAANRLSRNYAWPGHRFIQHVVNNQDVITRTMEKAAISFMTQTHTANGTMAGRNHATTAAAMLVAAITLDQQKIFPVSPKLVHTALANSMQMTFDAQSTHQTTAHPLFLIRDYLMLTARNRITVVKSNGRYLVDDSLGRPLEPFSYEVRIDSKEILIPLAAFEEWVRTRQPHGGIRVVMQSVQPYVTPTRRLCDGVANQTGLYQDMIVAPNVNPLQGFFAND